MNGRVRVGILISGRGSNMSALIAAAKAEDYPADIALVISNVPDAGGLEVARAEGVQAIAIDSRPFGKDRQAHEQAMDAALRQGGVEVVCLAGFMRLLTPWFVDAWSGRILNIHPSLLPDFKGLHTHARAIEAGRAEAGCTVHIVTADLDDGPILGQARVPVLPGDDEQALAARVLKEEHQLYPRCLAEFSRTLR
jgi:phosphoribosylglycinamide formyltransferase-1/phosphoribosylamine--glycine ligase/phosphoribosylglycinamide formyltransferase/phosphoribosylformylglycinamidine cyclo-ligase